MMKIPRTGRKTNEEVLEMAECTRSIINKTRKRKAKFMGHVMRRNGMENLITTGKLEGKRGRGRQRQKMMDDTTKWLGTGRNTQTIRNMYEKVEWRTMITDAEMHGTP